MKIIVFLVAIVVSAIGQMLATVNAHAAQSVITAAQVNGTWRSQHGELKIWALGKQRLRVKFSGIYEYSSLYGPMANTGEGAGIAVIEGDTAVFKPDDTDAECRITIQFMENGLNVGQDGICGFGHNVSAAGAYRKISGRKPKFDLD
ncbi:MAG: hypothetical protein U1F42_10265 [Candidatus Competibacteraceae bacterium]